ncbi:type I polyketide synthase [Ruegeria profundi]|nr:type I polyketide synthase [Ruegeria profundi]MCA0926783.1 SDR family oxidoreductase [Ruegeria profundi]
MLDYLTDKSFEVIGFSIPNYLGSKVPHAACKAKHVGCLDLEYADPTRLDVLTAVSDLRAAAPALWGLKLTSVGLDAALDADLLCDGAPHTIVIVGELAKATGGTIARLRSEAPETRVLVEVVSRSQIALEADLAPDGWLAKGHEAGGRSGDETAFILLQALRQVTDLPIIVHGGVGPDTVAALRLAGAAGVALDWPLALLDEALTPAPMHRALKAFDGSETLHVAGVDNVGYRLFWRPDHPPARSVKEVADANPSALAAAVADLLDPVTGGGVWLVGQDACFAKPMLEKYGRAGAALNDLLARSKDQIASAHAQRALARNSTLAQKLGTEFPIMQGPMTRVSDRAAFADCVADGGGLPFIALALMRGKEANELVTETKALLGNKPWGVGVLGFVDDALREEQLEIILRNAPNFALIAGGRPDQALRLEKSGIPTFLHVPSPGLLKVFLEQGSRRFIFEGRECGGHVGPRSSAVLWQQAMDALRAFYGSDPMDCQILFAGGIHDACSSAMVATIAVDAVAQGAEVGVLMGSAYILTKEAVAAGAVVQRYQDLVLGARETVLLESGVGHATRVVRSAIADEFQSEKARLLAEGVEAEDVKDALERFNVGRSRVASKGIDRNPNFGKVDGAAKYIEVPEADQERQGVYMIGQLASLRDSASTIADLHADVCDGAVSYLKEAVPEAPRQEAFVEGPGSRVAITGISTILPKAQDQFQFWENILDKVDAITEVPERRWDWRRYFDEDRDAPDKSYSRWGGFVDEMPFDPIRYGIPPNSMTSVEPLQLLTLELVRKALEDAGFEDGVIPDAALRRRTSVIIGVGGGAAPMGQQYAVRATLPALLGQVPEAVTERLPQWTEDSFPGVLLNVIAGRVANRFDLGGVNFTVDAACGSSLAAVMTGVRELETGTSDMVIVAGVDAFMSPFDFVAFSKTRALSARGRCRTFDASADGIAISEGLVAMVLRPLEAAEAASDRIYAVLRGVAGASDGRDLSLTAPRPEGQQETLRRAYERAGISPSSVSLVEAHGTGTIVGDRTEVQSLTSVFGPTRADKQFCAIGSVKSMIGHTKAAAGCAGMAKMALALHHRILPPTMHVVEPNPTANFQESPFYPNVDARPWMKTGTSPRRAGVSAFGFGGTNFHAVLEEYDGGYLPRHQAPVRQNWSHELLLFSADDPAALVTDLRKAAAAFETEAWALRDVAASLAARFDAGAGARFAMVASSLADAATRIVAAAGALETGAKDVREVDPLGAYFAQGEPLKTDQIAFLFPGQGSQYPNMAAGLTMYFPAMRKSLDAAHEHLRDLLDVSFADQIYPRPAMSEAEKSAQVKRLMRTDVAQPAIGAISSGILSLLRAFGADAGAVAGHSFGELSALSAAGAFGERELWSLAHARGDAMISEGGDDLGTMTAVSASENEVREAVSDLTGITFANYNAPRQTVLAGAEDDLARVENALHAAEIAARRLPVACAFHSDFVAPARDKLARAIANTPMTAPKLPVFANETAATYPPDAEAVAETLTRHLTQPVRFMGSIEAMYESGIRLFVEVGPNAVLSRLTKRILGDKSHLAVATDVEGRSGVHQFLAALGAMSAAGVKLDLGALWKDRASTSVDVVNWKSEEETENGLLWMVDLASVRPAGTEVSRIGLAARIEDDTVMIPPSPSVSPAPVPEPATRPMISIPGQGSEAAVDVMRKHHALMAQMLESHQSTMQMLLGGAAAPATNQPDIAITPVPTPSTVEPKPSEPRAAETIAVHADPTPSPDVTSCDAQQVTHKLLELISERTGYPPEMLGREMNLEADLGIDSIKRVEILASLRLHFLAEAGEAAHELMGPVARERSVDGIVARFMEVVDAVSGDAPAAATLTQAKADSVSSYPEPEGVAQKLLELISERTGYPPEMLGREMNLEADLGIDSIKRVEILASLRLHFLAEAGEAAHELMGPVARERSVDGIVTRFMEVVDAVSGDAPKAASVSAVEDALPAPSYMDGQTRRFVMVPSTTSVVNPKPWVSSGATYVITEDGQGVATALAALIEGAGGVPIVLPVEGLTPEDVASATEGHSVAGILHCAPLFSADEVPFEAKRLMAQVRSSTESLYVILSVVGPALATRSDAVMVVATRMGGSFGFDDNTTLDPTAGGPVGVLKTLDKEWAAAHVRAVDVSETYGPEDIAGTICDEAGRRDDAVEIGWVDGKRVELLAEPRPISLIGGAKDQNLLGEGSVVLVTGGARGITARCLLWLASKYQPRLVVAGSSPVPDAEEAGETAAITDPMALRAHLAQQAKAEGAKVTIAEIERTSRALLKAREIRANIAALKAAGAQVEYHQCDVRDGAALTNLIEGIYDTHGRIDGVIHGAGLIEDQLVIDKTLDSYRRVMATKAESAFTLVQALQPETVKFCAFFTSVAGRFGNRGQGDYGAANEIVSKLARRLDQAWEGRVVAISWGPWDSDGMVSDEVKAQFEALGIEALDPDLGIRALEAEILSDTDRVPEVVWGLGPWASDLTDDLQSKDTIKAAE